MNHRRLLAAVVCTGLFVLAAVGASVSQGKTAAPAATQASGTVTLSGWASSPTETALLRQVLRGFQKTFPQIKVDYAPISGDYPAAMLAKFAARTPPDVFYVDSNVMPDWIKQGVLQPLDSSSRGRSSRRGPSTRPCWGRSRGPTGRSTASPRAGLRSRWRPTTGILATAGVKAPTTQAQLAAAATKLKGVLPSGARPICLSPSWDRLLAFVYQNGGRFVNATKKKVTVNSAATRTAVNWYVGLIKRGLAGHTGPARRRLVRRGARQGEGRDRVRGQLAAAVHGDTNSRA